MKKSLTFLIAAIIMTIIINVAAASGFDVTVFQNNPLYDVEYDDMDDTLEISLVDDCLIMAFFDDDEGSLLGTIDIKKLEGYPPVLRLSIMYSGDDWIFIDKIILKPGDTRYTFEIDPDTDVSGGKIYEYFTLILTDVSIGLLDDIINSESQTAKLRLDGDREVNGTMYFLGDEITSLYNDYIAAGGLNGDFSDFNIVFPCEVK